MARLTVFAGLLILVFSAGMARTQPAAESCQPPDASLIKMRGQYTGRADLPDGEKIARYNEQARRFNECTRHLVDGNNDEIDKVRDAANADIARVRETANRKILDIQAKLQMVLGDSAPARLEDFPGAFPAPTCRKPDERSAQYARLQGEYETCVRSYISRASDTSQTTAATAQAEIQRITNEAQAKIAQLQGTVRSGIQTANAAALERSHAVEGTKVGATDPILMARAAENPEEDSKAASVWPVVADTPSGEGDPRTIICRAPQPLTNSRIMGPRICRRNGVWALLRKAGKDYAADGVTLVDLDIKRRTKPLACVMLPNETQRTSSLCN